MSKEFKEFSFGTQVRKSPFSDAALRWGAKEFSVYNHMYIPRDFGDPVQNFWNLVNEAILCDVAVERQVEIKGPDAGRFTQLLTCRDLSNCEVGQCKYVLITDENGGIINDPIILRLGEQRFWLSIADSDVLLWTRGLACGLGWDVQIHEPDVSPLAIQGPNNLPLMNDLFGDWVNDLKYFFFKETELHGIPLIVQRSGWSKQGGFELYLMDGTQGDTLWELVMKAGKKYGIKPATPNNIERIESGLFSWGNDMNLENNPLELPLGKFCQLDNIAEYISREALQRVSSEGVKNKVVGLVLDGDAIIGGCENPWQVFSDKKMCGKLTSVAHSPRLNSNIAFATVDSQLSEAGTKFTVETPYGSRNATVSDVPFI